MHAPLKSYLEVVYRILRYLKGLPNKGLLFQKGEVLKLKVYIDANWAGSKSDRRSTMRYCTFIGGNLVTWRSKKQPVAACSTAEVEFRAMVHGICELLWLRIILSDLKVKIESLVMLYCDNNAAIGFAHNPVQHDWTKHVEINRHFVKEKLDSK